MAKRTSSRRSRPPAKAGAAPKAPRAVSAPMAVRLVTPAGAIDLPWPASESEKHRKLQQQAMKWANVVRNRARWMDNERSAAQQDENARAFLEFLGLTKPQREQIGAAGSVCVAIPYTREDVGWEARILPWEFILPAATRDERSGPLVVTRSLIHRRPRRAATYGKVLFVESAPGLLANDWDFEDERRLVKQNSKAATFKPLVSPSLSELSSFVAKFKPHIIHLAGFDSHQGLELVEDTQAESVLDGYLLADGAGVDPVPARQLAEKLTPGTFAPTLVVCNIWNSAARVAPLLIAEGAHAVIGFQDRIDDAVAEIFLGNFYRALASTHSLDAAFQEAWHSMQGQSKTLRGSGIVLWQGEALGTKTVVSKRLIAPAAEISVLSPDSVTAQRAREILRITVEPEPLFSYGLLHNNRNLFQKFLIRNLSDQRIQGLEVFVELHTNDGTYPYRQALTIDGSGVELTEDIRIALTSNLARTLDEMLRTSLYVCVEWGGHVIFRETYPVTLAPVDQWTDTDVDRIFLPSFVFPRDPAVTQIIKSAEHFMTSLRDNPATGFDGYQSVNEGLKNVDGQVQALWYSVLYRVPASYINPPPTYAVASQRIRTPSEIINGGFGTCIDLAVMFASCLEAIEIHPVIFVLEDHAFPGFWRTETARTRFKDRVLASASDPDDKAKPGDGGSAKRNPGAAWCYDRTALKEIRKSIDDNRLVPIESVGLSDRSGFAESIAYARENYFAKAKRFLLMLDVKEARDLGVTPLPLGQRR